MCWRGLNRNLGKGMKALTTVQERLREYSLKLSVDGTNMHNGKTIETVPCRRGGVSHVSKLF